MGYDVNMENEQTKSRVSHSPLASLDRTHWEGAPSETPRALEAQTVLADVKERLFGQGAEDRPTMGRFQVLRRIGSGAMGVVFEGYDPDLDRRVALKMLRPEIAARRALQGRSRMLREAQALARLRHPHVTMVYEVGTDDASGALFIAMELVEGRTLRRWLRSRPRSWGEIVRVFLQAGRGLAAAHRGGVVHRDFKPDNLIIDDEGDARVVDFGLARSTGLAELLPTLDDAESGAIAVDLTCTGAVIGTPAYMAPEQFGGGRVLPASDQFSFCVTLFEALYGRRPFPGNDLPSLQRSLLGGEPVGPRRGVPRRLYRVLRRGLDIDPRQRYPDMDALLDALQACVGKRRTGRSLAWLAGVGVAVTAAVALPGGDEPTAEPASVQVTAQQAAEPVAEPTPDRVVLAASRRARLGTP